ncbi:MAG: serine hydrolase [Henriciella sp.]
MIGKSALIGMVFLFAGMASAQDLVPLPPQPEGLAWPTAGWEEGDLPPDIEVDIQALVDDAMSRELEDLMGETRAIVIIHRGKLVLEAYRDGFGPETKQVSWSMAKSVTSALVGRAIELRLIDDIDYPMPVPFDDADPRSKITWRHWLNMTDGLDYTEIGAAGLADNDVVQMMYGPGRFDVISYIRDELPADYKPGTSWNYSTAGYHLIARALADILLSSNIQRDRPGSNGESIGEILRSTDVYQCEVVLPNDASNEAVEAALADLQPCLVARAMWAILFEPLGMDAQPEFDAAGNFLGGSLVWASARDFAKFGYLYLRDGVWEGERLLPQGWVDFSRSDPVATEANVYGGGWWITTGGAEPFPSYQRRNLPPWDSFAAEGHEGQTLYVVPSRDLIIVRLGLMDNGGTNWPALFEWNQSVASLFPEL